MSDEIKVGDWVQCIDAINARRLTDGKTYQVVESQSPYFLIINDLGGKSYWNMGRFKKINKPEETPMTLNKSPEEISAAIDKMDALCSTGRQQVKQLFSEVFGVEFEKDPEVKAGQIYTNTTASMAYMVVENLQDSYSLRLVGLYGSPCTHTDDLSNGVGPHLKFKANSLVEYIEKYGTGEIC